MKIILSWPLLLILLALWKIRVLVYKFKSRNSLKTPVLSVGNLTMGGTGKTPMVDYLLEFLKKRKPNVELGVLSRGYRAESLTPKIVGQSDFFAGDEIEWLHQRHPDVDMAVCKKRFLAGALLEQNKSYDLFLLDDGFQHWDLNRQFDLVLIDATQGADALALFPVGQAREPLLALRRASAFALTKVNWADPKALVHLKKVLALYAPEVPTFPFEANLEVPTLDYQDIILASGIAHPTSLEDSLKLQGLHIRKHFKFVDHHDYTARDVEKLIASAHSANRLEVIVTEKDYVKLKKLWPRETRVVLKVVKMKFFPLFNEDQLYASIAKNIN